MASDDADRLCEIMHDAYEDAAAGSGWVTNPASRKPWADVPEANKAATRAAVSALVAAVRAQVAAEIEADRDAQQRESVWEPCEVWRYCHVDAAYTAMTLAARVARGGQHD